MRISDWSSDVCSSDLPLTEWNAEAGTVSYYDPEDGQDVTVSILSGGAKLQWKVDWAMRWVALGVDYEMAGKDLIDSVTQSSKIARILRSEEHTSELQSLMRISYAVFCLKKKQTNT